MTNTFRKNDIVMYRKQHGVTRNWFGYITSDYADNIALIRWWDDKLMRWSTVQAIPMAELDLIGRVDEDF